MKKLFIVLLFLLPLKIFSQEYTPPDSVEIPNGFTGVSFVVPISEERIDGEIHIKIVQVRFEIEEKYLSRHNGKTYFIVPKNEFWDKYKKIK